MRFLWLLLATGLYVRAEEVTFHRDVEPILQKHCQSCHRPGEIGPMPLMNYAQVRPWAKSIGEAVALRKMPPWFADPAVGHFANDPSLSADELSTVRAWVIGGAREGVKTDAPAPVVRERVRPAPDLVTRMPKPIRIPANQTLDYQYIVLSPAFSEDRWVSAVDILPGDRGVVHHAVLYVREPGSRWLREGDPKSGTTSDILAIYTPGAPLMECPPGMAKKIPAGSDLVLQMHYNSRKTDAKDQTEIRVWYAKETPQSRVLTLQMSQYGLRIPPGARSYRAAVSGSVPRDAVLLSMFPHMHLRGSGFEYQILGKAGRVDTLLRVEHYNFYWQLNYRLATPRLLPAGTQLLFTGYYDNSANNPLNPDPTEEVTWGEQSQEEMMVGFFDVAVPASVDKPSFFIRAPGR